MYGRAMSKPARSYYWNLVVSLCFLGGTATEYMMRSVRYCGERLQIGTVTRRMNVIGCGILSL